MKYTLTGDNILDIFTKVLPRPKFEHFAKTLGLNKM